MLITKKLNCGVRMVMEEIPHVQSAAVGIWVRVGSADETKEISGISHYIEHMMFKGTESRSAKQIAEDVDRIGGNINAFTGKESTCYYIKTLSSNLERACSILLDMFLKSSFDPEEMRREKSVVLEEMKMIEDTPDEYAQDILAEAVFRGTPLQRSVIGTEESLLSISRQDILDFIKREYTREDIVVSIAGNFDSLRMFEFFEGRLDGLKEKKEDKRLDWSAAYVPAYAFRIKDVEQSHISLGIPGIPMEHELYYPMSLLNSIMGGSMSSRLFQNIREEKGLAYSVFSMSASYSMRGLYTIYAGVAKGKTEDALRGIAEELHKLETGGVTEEEISMAREQLKSNYIFGQENVNSRMFVNGKNTLMMGRVKSAEEVIEQVDRVNMTDIHRAMEIITDIKKYCGVVVSGSELDLESILQSC